MNASPDLAIADRLVTVRERLAQAALRYQRDPRDITLLAVSKMVGPEVVRAAAQAGQRDFGENYLQEALDKQLAISDSSLIWHFIGPIQRNKTRGIAENFAWVHSLDRLKIAERLSAQRPLTAVPLNVCIEVNISGEASKGGVLPQQLPALAQAIVALPQLRLRGLMAIPAPTHDVGEQRAAFQKVRELFEGLRQRGLDLDTLSMGMSGDFEAAIAEGATLVRIGTAIFGKRDYPAVT
ncbi:MAG: YggS family pyridoxal phosphate-dependent enzyme [Thiobacillaceae bacterium]